MIAFDNVIPVLNLSVLKVRRTLTFTFKPETGMPLCCYAVVKERGRVPPVPAQPFFHFRRITLDPAIEGGVVDMHTTFGQHLL
ncbi:p11 [Lasius niger]|uniref:p11 n=1 Tax=Lasius niger TaxID=67767 RepID=A0A0J7MLM5_LASNI|nr:p11 [Lasius niger]